MKYYLCKYIPPRADFLATMTADEKQALVRSGFRMILESRPEIEGVDGGEATTEEGNPTLEEPAEVAPPNEETSTQEGAA